MSGGASSAEAAERVPTGTALCASLCFFFYYSFKCWCAILTYHSQCDHPQGINVAQKESNTIWGKVHRACFLALSLLCVVQVQEASELMLKEVSQPRGYPIQHDECLGAQIKIVMRMVEQLVKKWCTWLYQTVLACLHAVHPFTPPNHPGDPFSDRRDTRAEVPAQCTCVRCILTLPGSDG